MRMEKSYIEAIVGSVTSLILGALGAIKWLLPWMAARKTAAHAERYQEGLTALASALRRMEGMLKDIAPCGRVLLMSGHNGGGMPRIGSPYYVTCVHHVHDSTVNPGMPPYVHVGVDLSYIELLLKVISDGFVRYEFPAGAMLTDFYEAEGVQDSVLCYLGVYDKHLYYMSAASYGERFSPAEVTRIRLTCSTIANDFRNF